MMLVQHRLLSTPWRAVAPAHTSLKSSSVVVPIRRHTHQGQYTVQGVLWSLTAPPQSRARVKAFSSALSGSDLSVQMDSLRSAAVVVATRPGCPYCKKAKAALDEAGVAYQEFDASQDAGLRSLVKDVSNSSTVPQVFVGGKSLGGFDDLSAAMAAGTFQAALSAAQASKLPALPSQLVEVLMRLGTQQASGSAAGQGSNADQVALTEVAALLADPVAGVTRSVVTIRGMTLPAFTGDNLIQWLLTSRPTASDAASTWLTTASTSAETAAAAATQLLTAHVITPVSADPPYPLGTLVSRPAAVSASAQYVLVNQVGSIPKGQPLNTSFWWSRPARPASQVAAGLRDLILRLYDRHLSAAGKAVNYQGIKADPLFQDYITATAELQQVDISVLTRDELAAFFINMYNALIIHALCVVGAPASVLDRSAFFSKNSVYCIGGLNYTADDMEHGVLRANKGTASIWILAPLAKFLGGQFKSGDPRAAKIVTPLDPRVHFALVCGAKSCPPISVYTADNLDEGLAAAGEAFCGSEVEVNKADGVVKLSKILQWYSGDFGKDDTEKLRYITQFLKGSTRSDLEALLASGKRIKIEYKPYDWNLND